MPLIPVKMYNIMVLGSGGREHAIAWKIKQSPKCKNLFIAPGNAGTAQVGTNLNASVSDFAQLRDYINEYQIDYLIVGPEVPLVEGIYDFFLEHKVKVVGPSAKAAMLEGSKSFANDFMKEFGIPTAASIKITNNNLEEGIQFIDRQPGNIVLKADGLAAGKGVLIIPDKEKAKTELKEMLQGKFGDASSSVVIEEFLDGIEFSVFVITDGENYQLLPVAKDYKRIGEGDTGLNTGGMGAVSPVPFADGTLMQKVKERIIQPTIDGLKSRNYDYKGFIFFGLIKVNEDPYVIEYNCRMGDPETEVVIPRITSDLVEHIVSIFDGSLKDKKVIQDDRIAATIMLVSGGYPETYEKGKNITLNDCTDSILFHAGTKVKDGQLKTNGGRVIAVTSLADTIASALSLSKNCISKIDFDKMYYRNDIGFDL